MALKTAGLLPLMAQTGLLVPAAEGTQVPVFRSVFADIGDEQSIAASLSTFSGHIANIVAMDRALTLPALVLLDEAGGGTDPNEGGALAMAMIDHFRVRGAMVVATTHYDALKSYAVTTEGVTPAGFGFDPATFAPTYRLQLRRTGQQPGARDRDAARVARLDHRERAPASQRPRGAARRAPGEGRARHPVARARAPSGGARALGPRRRGEQDAGARAGAPQSRGDLPPPPRRTD